MMVVEGIREDSLEVVLHPNQLSGKTLGQVTEVEAMQHNEAKGLSIQGGRGGGGADSNPGDDGVGMRVGVDPA